MRNNSARSFYSRTLADIDDDLRMLEMHATDGECEPIDDEQTTPVIIAYSDSVSGRWFRSPIGAL